MGFNFGGGKKLVQEPEAKKGPVPSCPDCHVPMERYGKTDRFKCPKCGREV